MSTRTATHFIHISTDSDCWGSNTEGFDCVTEAERIRDAAESAGIEVAFDVDRRNVNCNDDGSERTEIDWFGEWCTAGYEWSDEQWIEWFSPFARR